MHFILFILSKDNGSRIEELGKLCNLHGKFTIFRLEHVASGKNASMAKIKDRKYIQELTLKWNGDTKDSQVVLDVLENLQPHTSIKHVKIDGYCGTRFPDWLQDSSFCHITNLHIFNCENCYCLPAIWKLPSLKHLFIRDLNKVVEIGQAICGNNCLEELDIRDCPELIGEIPKKLPSLKKLAIFGCPRLVNPKGELVIFDSEADFSSLNELEIRGMPNMKELSSSKLDLNKILPRLKRLLIEDCGDFILERCELTQICHASINELNIKNLSLSLFPILRVLKIWSVRNMEELSIAQGNQNLTSLRYLCMDACDNFVSFPVGGIPAPNLTNIYLSNFPMLKSLPERMHTLLPSLQILEARNCPEIECFPEGGLPSSLQSLYIRNCKRLWSCHGEWGLQRLPSFRKLSLCSLHQEETWPPKDLLLLSTLTSLVGADYENVKTLDCGVLQHLTCLQSLYILDCPKLQSMSEEGLPASISELRIDNCPMLQSLPEGRLPASLSDLTISGCPMLQSLPGEGLPASLARFTVIDCPLLKQRLEWEKGEDWPRVEHIPHIRVDLELLP